jgi:hypothetical protein
MYIYELKIESVILLTAYICHREREREQRESRESADIRMRERERERELDDFFCADIRVRERELLDFFSFFDFLAGSVFSFFQ